MTLSNVANQLTGSKIRFHRLLVVIKQTAFEEYSQLKLRGQAPKALRWKRLESRYNAHKRCVNDLLGLLREHKIEFSCVNRVELDRQHLSDVDLVVAVGGDGTVLSTAHFLDHGTIPLLGINSDPISRKDLSVENLKKKTDERRSHGALCMCTARSMYTEVPKVLHGESKLSVRTRVKCVVKSTFSETRIVPVLNDILITNPCPAAVSRFRMGWLQPDHHHDQNDNNSSKNGLRSFFEPLVNAQSSEQHNGEYLSNLRSQIPSSNVYGTVTRFSGIPYDVVNSINVWSSGLWVPTATGSSAAIHSAGAPIISDHSSPDLQYLIREHMTDVASMHNLDKGMLSNGEQLHIRWNSQKGKIFVDGSHLNHNLELGDEILINNTAPTLSLFMTNDEDDEEEKNSSANVES